MDMVESHCESPIAMHEHRQPITVLLPAKKGRARLFHALRAWLPYIALAGIVGPFCFFGPRAFQAPLPQAVAVLFFGALLVGMVSIACVHEGRNKRQQARKNNRYALSEALQADPDLPLRGLLTPSPRLDRLLADVAGEEEMMEFLQPRAFLRDAVCLSMRPRPLPDRLEPLAVPFEPMLLTAASTSLRPLTTMCGETHNRRLGTNLTAWSRSVRRILSVPDGGWLVLWSSWLLLRLVGIVSTGHLTLGDLLIHIPVLFLCVRGLLRSLLATERMYVIPGGLIDTRKKYVYRRGKGLMIWCPDSNTLHVRSLDADRDLALVVTPSEAVAAIRAWLSPAPEPSDEAIKLFLEQRH